MCVLLFFVLVGTPYYNICVSVLLILFKLVHLLAATQKASQGGTTAESARLAEATRSLVAAAVAPQLVARCAFAVRGVELSFPFGATNGCKSQNDTGSVPSFARVFP